MNPANTSFWMRGPQLSLDARRVVLILMVPAFGASLIQLGLGASPLVVALAMMVTTIGLLGFAALGAYNAGSWLILFFVLGNELVALYGKTLLGQPLDSNLYAPMASYLVLTVAALAMFAALVTVRFAPVGKPLLKPTANPRTLCFLSWGSLP